MSWETAWQEGRTPWDAAKSPPVLHEILAGGSLAPGRVIVPGCGTGYDVFTFAEAGFDALGLDLAPTAAARFAEARDARGIDPAKARIEVGDFFRFAPDAPFDVFWDYTFLCAIDPSERPRWAETVERLVAPGGELITLLFPVVDVPPRGEGNPPFPLTPDRAKALLEPRWEPTTLAPVMASHPGRQGKEWLGRWRRRA